MKYLNLKKKIQCCSIVSNIVSSKVGFFNGFEMLPKFDVAK